MPSCVEASLPPSWPVRTWLNLHCGETGAAGRRRAGSVPGAADAAMKRACPCGLAPLLLLSCKTNTCFYSSVKDRATTFEQLELCKSGLSFCSGYLVVGLGLSFSLFNPKTLHIESAKQKGFATGETQLPLSQSPGLFWGLPHCTWCERFVLRAEAGPVRQVSGGEAEGCCLSVQSRASQESIWEALESRGSCDVSVSMRCRDSDSPVGRRWDPNSEQ